MARYYKIQKIAFILFIVVIAGSLLAFQIFSDEFDVRGLRTYIDSFGIWAPLVFVLFYIVGTIFIPSTPFMAMAGILFGFKYGLLYTGVAGLLSSIIVFDISRRLGKDRVDDFLEKKRLNLLARYNEKLETHGIWTVFILRVTPIMPFNVLNLLMGISKIKVRDYVIGTVLGLLPSNILTVYFGDLITALF